MTHITAHEWASVYVHDGPGDAPEGWFTRGQANALVAAARVHPMGGKDGSAIVEDRHNYLRLKQMVGVISARGCSLEILPKIDPDEQVTNVTIRGRLVSMLEIALGLKIGLGMSANIARQSDSLLEIIVRHFADSLLVEARRGLPRRYLPHEEDLPKLRGRLNVRRQFTTLAVRSDRLASQFDALSNDIPLLQIMSATVRILMKHTKNQETLRRLGELRFLLSEVSEVPISTLPWKLVHINRTNHRWQSLLDIARRFLKRDWQATHTDSKATEGLSLLFPVNDLFESYVEALLKKAAIGTGLQIKSQGGRKYCLTEEDDQSSSYFQTKPDLLVMADGQVMSVIDTKWKRLSPASEDAKQGVSQGDVYQMMAYARLYGCSDLTLLYPYHDGLKEDDLQRHFRLNGDKGQEKLSISALDITGSPDDVVAALHQMFLPKVSQAV